MSSSADLRCARRGYPGLYTDVHHYMASGWLTEVLRDAETCPPPPEGKEDIVSVKEKTTTPTTATSTTPELSENDATSYSDVLLVIGGSGYSFGRKVCYATILIFNLKELIRSSSGQQIKSVPEPWQIYQT